MERHAMALLVGLGSGLRISNSSPQIRIGWSYRFDLHMPMVTAAQAAIEQTATTSAVSQADLVDFIIADYTCDLAICLLAPVRQ